MFNQEYGLTNDWVQSSELFKISLMSLSDYYWSPTASGINCYSNYDTCKSSWLHICSNYTSCGTSGEWTSTYHYSTSPNIYSAANISYNGRPLVANLTSENFVRPVFYLIANTVIKSGDGSESDPFIIQV